MAMDNLKDFGVEWALFGLLFFCMISFSIVFIANNNPGALGEAGTKFDGYSSSMNGTLLAVEGSSNNFLNISSQTNPEVSDQGSKDSVATSYGITSTGKSFFDSTKLFMGWVLTGTTGKMLISLFAGLFGLLSIYFITKWIRIGA